MPPKKSIFRQPGAKHFQLVHRSQRDPLTHDTDASQQVLRSFERENTRKVRLQNSEIDKANQIAQGKSRADLESLLPASVLEYDKKRNIGEAALYGIHYDDTEYDYMQHLRTVGAQDDGVESIMIEAPIMKNNRGKGIIKDDLFIPQEALPSTSELPRNYESQQAIPESIAGFQPDMDPHLRQALEALEDDAFVDDNLTDDFFSELVDGGERGPEEIQFDFDENNIEDSKDRGYHEDEHDDSSSGLSWEERFAQFKRVQAGEEIDSTSDDEFASEGGDTIRELPTISVLGGKGKRRRKGSSDASGYTMSSSSMHRNKALQMLDERFDRVCSCQPMSCNANHAFQIMQKEYREEVMEQPASDEDTDEVPELITSREDFDSMVNEFLQNYEILGKKMKPKLEGDTPINKLDTIRNALRQVRINDDADDEAHDLMSLEDVSKEDRWDCETILSLYLHKFSFHKCSDLISNPL